MMKEGRVDGLNVSGHGRRSRRRWRRSSRLSTEAEMLEKVAEASSEDTCLEWVLGMPHLAEHPEIDKHLWCASGESISERPCPRYMAGIPELMQSVPVPERPNAL